MIELLNVESAKSGKITAGEACRRVSQYTLRYRYVTGSGLRPDTPKVNGLTRPGGLVCSRHPLTDKL